VASLVGAAIIGILLFPCLLWGECWSSIGDHWIVDAIFGGIGGYALYKLSQTIRAAWISFMTTPYSSLHQAWAWLTATRQKYLPWLPAILAILMFIAGILWSSTIIRWAANCSSPARIRSQHRQSARLERTIADKAGLVRQDISSNGVRNAILNSAVGSSSSTATSQKTNVTVWINSPNNGGVAVGINNGTINNVTHPMIETKPPQPIIIVVTNTIIENRQEKNNADYGQPVAAAIPVNLPITTDWSQPVFLPDPRVKIVDFNGDLVENDVRCDVLVNGPYGSRVYWNVSKGNFPTVIGQTRYIQYRVSNHSPVARGTIRYSMIHRRS